MKIEVYVIIVTYNAKKWIDRCFLSLRKSSIPLKIIVVDNGSNDGSQEIIKHNYPEVELVQSKHNLGFGKANNIGIEKAYDQGANYFFLLNQDAWVEPMTIELLVSKLKEDSSFGVLSPMHLNGEGDAFDLNFSNYISPVSCPNLYSDMYLDKNLNNIYESLFINAAAWLMSRKCIEEVGGFSPSFFHYGEDVNYLHRMTFHNLKLGVFPLTNIFHDRLQREISAYFSNYCIMNERYFTSYYSDPNLKVRFLRVQFMLLKYIIKPLLKGKSSETLESIGLYFKLMKKMPFLKENKFESMKANKLCFLSSSYKKPS